MKSSRRHLFDTPETELFGIAKDDYLSQKNMNVGELMQKDPRLQAFFKDLGLDSSANVRLRAVSCLKWTLVAQDKWVMVGNFLMEGRSLWLRPTFFGLVFVSL